VVKGAKGDFVWLVFEYEGKDSHDPSKVIRGNSFDILRIQSGKIQEHWDSARKSPGSPPFVPSTAAAPSSWNPGAMSPEEQVNLKLATEFSKDILQYGHVELTDQITDPNFIEHNANVPQSRAGFEQFLSHSPDRAPQPIKPEWKTPPVLTIADGPYVVMMWGREDKDPSDPSKVYTRNYFDVLRIQNGLIQEDWN
jgi:predicted SnoaL-like aldol condensation-catalyzing enzyme